MYNRLVTTIFVICIVLTGFTLFFPKEKTTPVIINPIVSPVVPVIQSEKPTIETKEKTSQELIEQFRDMKLIDSHNHDASNDNYLRNIDMWKFNAVNQVVLFGDVSEPSAINTDEKSWEAYQANPDLFIPYFSGFDLHDKSSLEVIKNNLEKGYFGLGEIVAASTYSPVVSIVAWKGQDPMDGFLPDIYEICALYKAPILLHIDPAYGPVIDKLEEALDKYPTTLFIFGHANAFNSPENLQPLLKKHPNLYLDFFAGFTALNPESSNKLEDFIPLMQQYPNRFMLSTDSGYGLESEEAAIGAMYQLLDKLNDPLLARKIAHDNLDTIIQNQPATKTQLEAIEKKSKETGKNYELSHLSKVEAGQILWN